MKDNTLRDIENTLTRFNSDMCQSQGSDTPVSDQQRDKEKATEAIMKLVVSKVPKQHDDTDVPSDRLNAQEDGEVMGWNSCREEMLYNLGVEE